MNGVWGSICALSELVYEEYDAGIWLMKAYAMLVFRFCMGLVGTMHQFDVLNGTRHVDAFRFACGLQIKTQPHFH